VIDALEGRSVYAGVVSRGAAFVIDVIATTIIVAGASATIRMIANVLDIRVHLADDKALAYAALPIMFILYCAVCWAMLERTPGMALLGIRVVRKNGGRPGFVRSFVRALCYALSAILLIGFAWSAVDRRRQGFHDKIAGTVVVYDRVTARSAPFPLGDPASFR
jgi:uncharacterized RDD family membrane protein YckC